MDQAARATHSDDSIEWHARHAGDVAGLLGTDPARGLEAAEAAARLERYGPNRIRHEAAQTWLQVLIRQFRDVLIAILVAAAIISFAVGEVVDGFAILAIVILNGILGFVQEWRAEQALTALQQMLSPSCTVIRQGVPMSIDSVEIVPGDAVSLEIGDRVPADLRLVEAINLKVDESALTGESGSVDKGVEPVAGRAPLAERSSMAWMGTNVTNGRAIGIAVVTGMGTEFGKIAELTESLGSESTPLKRKLAVLGKYLGAVAIAISVAVVLLGILVGDGVVEMFLTGVSLAVAVVPEGLPAVVTITLALGVRSMVKRRALLRTLQAAEALGSASVICTDKTGTLTENEMTVTRIWLPAGTVEVTGTGYDPAGHFESGGTRVDPDDRTDLAALLETGLICNHAHLTRDAAGWHQMGEPTEAALIVAAHKAWLEPGGAHDSISEFSFSSARKRMTVVTHRGESRRAHVKGAPEVILGRCGLIRDGDTDRRLTAADRDRVEQVYREMAGEGLRTLALARRDLPSHIDLDEDAVERDLTLLGVVGIIDPPRPEVPAALELASRAGIRTIMITGDAAGTAATIAANVGLEVDRTVNGPELSEMSDAELALVLRERVLFARTAPAHKLRIVRLLQEEGAIVAMTGDGVNDAPALKQADIGVAMGMRGTDVAKAASDMVLTDDNFASIVGAVEEGRRQYDNIQKFVRYLLSSNAGEVVAVFFNILIGAPLILLPVQILWMNLITDGVTAVALGVEPAADDLMRQPPRGAREPIVTRSAALTIVALGLYVGGGSLWLFHHYLEANADLNLAKAQTMAFVGIVVLEKINVFNFRSLRQPISRIGFFSNPWLLGAWAAMLSLQVAAVYVPFLQDVLHTVPLGWRDWVTIFLVALPVFLIVEGIKIARSHRQVAQGAVVGSHPVTRP
jgi:Ca2+-transporting ATPase